MEVKIDQVEEDAFSKTIMLQGVCIDSLLENNLQDMKDNMAGINSAMTNDRNWFVHHTNVC